ncbi:uncharacterized protein [Prorops nasuta]|uniref:uncharacterized protein isoform X2 n=1 Tax=Prorops nasuta TaxID=863751 RepID=UPI0034CEF451
MIHLTNVGDSRGLLVKLKYIYPGYSVGATLLVLCSTSSLQFIILDFYYIKRISEIVINHDEDIVYFTNNIHDSSDFTWFNISTKRNKMLYQCVVTCGSQPDHQIMCNSTFPWGIIVTDKTIQQISDEGNGIDKNQALHTSANQDFTCFKYVTRDENNKEFLGKGCASKTSMRGICANDKQGTCHLCNTDLCNV